ncbi:MAG TPA: discoidin domain-containing protein, partial [Acidobacteriota bacterium]|nr:discoidin domain-containing protein [Acidobacteriota bacterium]
KVSGIELSSSRDLTNYALNKKVSAACELMSNENMSMVKNLSRITNGIYNFDAIVPPPLNDSRYEYVQINACSNPKCVTVDMGQVFTLKNVVAYNWPRMLNLQNMTMRENIIQISKDAITWRTVFNFSSQGDYPTFNGPQKISFTTPKDAQYVRQCIDGNLLDGNSTWFQIEAWG